jgi:predicted transposase
MYTMKIQLLTDREQHLQLTEVMRRFNEVCNHISEVGFRTKTNRNKIKLSKECYNDVRQRYNTPAQMVVRAIGKVVEAYKTGAKTQLKFGETTSVVYDTRLLAFKWMQCISIATFDGRIEIPFRVTGYRQGTYERRVNGQADLVLQDNQFYLLLLVNLPETTSITPMEFAEVAT